MVVYNSKLNFQKDGYAYGQKFDTNKFLRITDAQAQTQVFTDSATPTFKTNVLLSGRDREKDFLPLDPNWEFWGNAENNLWIDIPTFDGIDIQADATYENVATLLFEGFTVVGAAQ